ncbi:hypothetical protein [Propionicicella superfundia]|uniref:hypothetical protein n=1 Tax=Propionicicella superfundia TaxID=348582 RepID=UPI00040B7D4B|nr:hypothetical protein [Propionicicella superfundia]
MNQDQTNPEEPTDAAAHRSTRDRLTRALETLSDPAATPLTGAMLAEIHARAARTRLVLATVVCVGVIALVVGIAVASRLSVEPVPSGTETTTPYIEAGGGVGTPAAPSGFRWETRGSVSVAVPDDWTTGSAPRPDYCARPATPARPYIDLDYATGSTSTTCPAFPDAAQAIHVTLNDASAPAPWQPESSTWTHAETTIADTRITVVFTSDQANLAHQILESAHDS